MYGTLWMKVRVSASFSVARCSRPMWGSARWMLLLGVVAHLHVAGHREVLAERVPHEAVVGEDAAQVRVAAEDDAVEVERLALVPVGRGPHRDDRFDLGKLVVGAEHANAHAPVVGDRQQDVDDREAGPFPRVVVALVVDAHQVEHLGEGEALVVTQPRGHLDEVLRRDLEGELIAVDRLLRDAVAERRGERGLEEVEGCRHGLQRREMVCVRLILFCSWIKP